MGYSSAFDLRQIATPTRNPPAGTTLLYVKSDGKVYTKDSSGNEQVVGAGSGGPPSGSAGGSLAGTYPNPTIAAGAVGSTEIADGSIQLADLASVVKPAPVQNLVSGSTNNIPTAAWTTVTGWGTNGAPYFSGITAGVGTVTTAGMYLCIASVQLASAAASRRMIRFVKNPGGSQQAWTHDYANSGGNPTRMLITAFIPFVVGDSLGVQVYQATGANLALDLGNGNHDWFMWRISGDTAVAQSGAVWP